MKIRHKQTGEVEEVEPTMTVPGYGWCKAGPLDVDRYYPKAYWEPVPEEVWEDCTAECFMQDDGLFHGTVLITRVPNMYRMQRVWLPAGQPLFKIERKRPA